MMSWRHQNVVFSIFDIIILNCFIIALIYTCLCIKIMLIKVHVIHYRYEDKVYQFWKDADFGYIKSVQESMQFVCKPKENKV